MSENVVGLFERFRAEEGPVAPSNEAAELAVLGTLLVRNGTLEQVADHLRPEHFFRPLHGKVYREVARRVLSGKRVDHVSLLGWMKSNLHVDFSGHGGDPAQYLGSLIGSAVTHEIGHYGRAIKDCWMRRELIAMGASLQQKAYDYNADAETNVIEFNERIDSLVSGGRDDMGFASFDDAVTEAVDHAKEAHRIGGPGGLSFPQFPKLSHAVTLQPEEFTILAGRSGSGKSALGWQWAIGLAREIRDSGRPMEETGGIVGFSLEMSKKALGIRQLSAVSGVPATDILHGRTTTYQLECVEAAGVELMGLPLKIIDCGGLTPAMMRLKFVQAKRYFKDKIALAIVDHLNLVDSGDNKNPFFGVGRVADAILFMAKRFQCPLLGLVQVNLKDLSQRKDHRPQQGDLRNSGNWGQNANNVMFLHREIQWEPSTPPTEAHDLEPPEVFQTRVQKWHDRQRKLEPVAELILDKCRDGKAGFTIPLLFDGRTTSFAEDPASK